MEELIVNPKAQQQQISNEAGPPFPVCPSVVDIVDGGLFPGEVWREHDLHKEKGFANHPRLPWAYGVVFSYVQCVLTWTQHSILAALVLQADYEHEGGGAGAFSSNPVVGSLSDPGASPQAATVQNAAGALPDKLSAVWYTSPGSDTLRGRGDSLRAGRGAVRTGGLEEQEEFFRRQPLGVWTRPTMVVTPSLLLWRPGPERPGSLFRVPTFLVDSFLGTKGVDS